METPAELERRALEQLRAGDLEGARGSLTLLLQHRPNDGRLRQRIAKIDEHIESQSGGAEVEALRWARTYVEAGRLAEALQLLRDALAEDPSNRALREFALQVAARLRAERSKSNEHRAAPADAPEPRVDSSPSGAVPPPPPPAPAIEASPRPPSGPEASPRPPSGPEASPRPPSGPEASPRPSSREVPAPRPAAARPPPPAVGPALEGADFGGRAARLKTLLAQIRGRRRPSGGLTESRASPRP